MMKHITVCLILVLTSAALRAQALRPGFDRAEYLELLRATARQLDTPWQPGGLMPERYRLVHRSAVTGLDNRWDLWLRSDDRVGMLSIRGTTGKTVSWLENFYAAMIPAGGSLRLSDSFTFHYRLCADPKAAVHAGWMIGLGSMSRDILAQIRQYHERGVRDFILGGHSQGGAICYLLTAWLRTLQQEGQLPADIRFKTYCSAAPKPGNLFFAYAYERLTAGGWAVNVVNPADWVPQTPFSVQTTRDFSTVNPFRGARKAIRRMPFPKDAVLGYLYGRLEGGPRKAERRFRRYLGGTAGREVKKLLPGFGQPSYMPSADYVRTGPTLVLEPDAGYYRRFPDSTENIFMHHMISPYLYLTERLPEDHQPR